MSTPPGLTLPFSVAEVDADRVAWLVVADVGVAVAVKMASAPFMVPDEFVATTRNQ